MNAIYPEVSYQYAEPVINHSSAQFDDVSGKQSVRGSFTHRVEQACEELATYHLRDSPSDLTPSEIRAGAPIIAPKHNVSTSLLIRILKG